MPEDEGLVIPVIAAVAVFTDAPSAAVLQGLPGLELDERLVRRVLESSDPTQTGIDAAIEEARELLAIEGVAGINVSGSASAAGYEAAAEVKAVGGRRDPIGVGIGMSEAMHAEFDTIADWTAAAARSLGSDYYLPAACRGSGSPASLDWLLDHLHAGQGTTVLDCGAGVGGPSAYAAIRRGVRPLLVEPEARACRAAQKSVRPACRTRRGNGTTRGR